MRSAIGWRARSHHPARRHSEPFDRNQLVHVFGIDPGVAQRDHSPERVGDDRHRRQLLLMDQLREVVDVGGHRIAAVRRPLAVAMTAQIGREDVPVATQRRGDPVPVAAMIPPAMDEQQRRRARISPIDIVQPQPLREINARGRSGAVEGHRYGSPPDMRRPPRAQGRQAGVGFAKLTFALGWNSRAKSWTLNSVADAKRSATRSLRVASCLLHTLPLS